MTDPMNRIRLLAVDLDGTLLDSRAEISAANRDALAAAHRRGVAIVLVTGRRFATARQEAAQIPVEMTLLTSNGAVVKDSSGRTLWRHLLPREQARAVLAAAGPYRKSAFLLFDRDRQGQIVIEDTVPTHAPVEGYFERNREYILQVTPLENALTEDPIQVLFAGAVATMRDLMERLHSSEVAAGVTVARTEYPQRDLALVDVLDRGCHKGAALAEWARRLGIAPAEVMAIGDNWNDCEMLEYAGVPVVMGNSSEGLKGRGWAVTSSNDESGVAAAIEEFVLAI
jgi:hypothetical protein